MGTLLATSVKSTAWQGSDGIITEGSSTGSNNDGVGFKGMSGHKKTLSPNYCSGIPDTFFFFPLCAIAIFIRGLVEAFQRNPSNTNLRILVHSYVDVQVLPFFFFFFQILT